MIDVIFSVPAATDAAEIVTALENSGYDFSLPDGAIMPQSRQATGKSLVHCVMRATSAEISTFASSQTPPWQEFGKKDTHGPTVHIAVNPSVWNHYPFEDTGAPMFTEISPRLHNFQGHAPWDSTRP